MERIDELLRTAKPLYLRRKRNRRIAAATSTLGAFCFVLALGFQSLKQSSTPIYDCWTDEIYQAQNGSVIEDMGLPTDEYGLFWIS